MKRRNFLLLTSTVISAHLLEAKELSKFDKDFSKVSNIIEAVQEHMFPKNELLPNAKSMNTIYFLFETMAHKSFNNKVRKFIINGAKWFDEQDNGEFLYMTHRDKEYALRRFEKTAYGKSWLSYLMTLTLEGILSDPIYGSNVNKEGWKSLDVHGGFPRPKKKYLKI